MVNNKKMIEVNFVIAPQIPSWSCNAMRTTKNSGLHALTVAELEKISSETSILLSISKEGFETDTLQTKSDNLVFFKNHLFEKIEHLINLDNFEIFQCEDDSNPDNKYTLLMRNCANLYGDLISEKGISITPGINQFIYFSPELVEKINELNSFGFLFRSSNIPKDYPHSLTFKELQDKAKEICEYAKVVVEVLGLKDDDPRTEEIGFQEYYPVSIIKQKSPRWDCAYVDFYENAAIAIRDYLSKHPKEKSIVDEKWKKRKGSISPPMLVVSDKELKEDPVVVFVETFLTKIDPVSWDTGNIKGASLKEIFDKIKKDAYSIYKSTLYETVYRGIAQIVSRWDSDTLIYVENLLEKYKSPLISELILNDEYFSCSFKNQPLPYYYGLPSN